MSEVKTYVAGHKSPDTDSICSAISFANLLTQMGTPATPVCAGEANKETTYILNHFGFEHPQIVKNWEEFAPEGGNLYLTDHNESKQIIDGYKSMNMCGVVDHHRIGDFETDGPVFMRLEPVGCSNTIITKLYIENNQEIPKGIAGLMLSAIISDTVLFRSPTCTETDKEMAHKLAEKINADVIVCETASGAIADSIAAERPTLPIISVTSSARVAGQLALTYANASFVRPYSDNYGIDLLQELKASGYVAPKEGSDQVLAVIVSGQPNTVSGTDTIQIRSI